MTYHIITYGCQMNEADSEVMASLLDQAGWRSTPEISDAELVVINTCSVREKPENKVYSLLGELRAEKQQRPRMKLAVTGCMAQGEAKELLRRARHVDVVLGTRCFHRIVEAVERVRAGERRVVVTDLADDPAKVRCEAAERKEEAPLRAFVPIILGCTNFCSYCIVPYVRGAETSRPPAEILSEVRDLVARGTREVMLLGQNVLAWGRDLPTRPTFEHLLGQVDDIEGLQRVRFITCHPRDVSRALVERITTRGKICEHIHLPMQAGTDKLLREMNRGYTVGQYRAVVDQLRAAVPGIAITTDMIVGFPGETDEDFEESLRVYGQIRFDAAFTFAYSPRPGTAAAERSDRVPRKVAVERLNRLIEAQNRITIERNQDEVGSAAEVLVEGPAERGEGLLAGKSRTNKQVVFPGDRRLAGTLVKVRLTEANLWGFMGETTG